MEKKLDGNYTRMLWAILNKSWRQHSIQDSYWKRWTIEKSSGRGSGISVLMVWHDDDDLYSTSLRKVLFKISWVYCLQFLLSSFFFIFLRWGIMYIIYIFRTIVLIFVAMFITTFWPLYAPAFFKWLECRTLPFISLTGVDCSSSMSHV